MRRIASSYRLPYFTLTPTFSVCPTHGYIAGEHFDCPKCADEQPCEVYSRVVGYLRPVQQWNKGKRSEYDERVEFGVPAAGGVAESAAKVVAAREIVPGS